MRTLRKIASRAKPSRARIMRPSLGPSYDSAALALFARFNSEPSAVRKGLINDLIVAGKDHGWWFTDDAFYITAFGLDDPGYLAHAPDMVAYLLDKPFATLEPETIFAPPDEV